MSESQAGKHDHISPRDFMLLHVTLLLYSAVSVFAKLASGALAVGDNMRIALFLGLELAALLIYTILWQQSLRRMPLSFAYSNKGVCTLWTCLFGIAFFGETLTWGKAAGIAVALVGVAIVVTDHE